MSGTIEHSVEKILQHHGTLSSKVELVCKNKNEGFGIYATSPIEPGDVLISVPFDLCITKHSVLKCSPLASIFEDNPGLVQYQDEVLAIGLMFGSKPQQKEDDPDNTFDSMLRNHISYMPKTFNTTIYWSEEEISELKPS